MKKIFSATFTIVILTTASSIVMAVPPSSFGPGLLKQLETSVKAALIAAGYNPAGMVINDIEPGHCEGVYFGIYCTNNAYFVTINNGTEYCRLEASAENGPMAAPSLVECSAASQHEK